jgi:hypothetical protein
MHLVVSALRHLDFRISTGEADRSLVHSKRRVQSAGRVLIATKTIVQFDKKLVCRSIICLSSKEYDTIQFCGSRKRNLDERLLQPSFAKRATPKIRVGVLCFSGGVKYINALHSGKINIMNHTFPHTAARFQVAPETSLLVRFLNLIKICTSLSTYKNNPAALLALSRATFLRECTRKSDLSLQERASLGDFGKSMETFKMIPNSRAVCVSERNEAYFD